ncbi:spore protease YyaC [Paenibacillus radicis (ex Xue et al. 2023)]|uniref:Spore protease YyaC n=1 Tax=Paenibacillus radicis (ex Xue et al. 2023) TaxID=2972489 RepID=A0ABT1YUZ8_9BACL|nr:spore protease YyaC [Paenibacillus radicis (ex Xue et al. 2023)]MCR8636765.1 spore protease YyaC [Paenibacillus radicis (ex Xue et al. 2023)]
MKFSFHRDTVMPKEVENLKVQHTENNIIEVLSDRLCSVLGQIPTQQPLIIVCVGTDRSTGDSLGPLVGSQLKKYSLESFHLYGTLEQPVHAMNLKETLEAINSQYNNPYIIAIDACLGQLASVGCIQIGNGPVKPGAGVNKELPPVGNMHITGIVNVGGFMEYFVLQNTRLSLVMSMSEVIARSFYVALSNIKRFAAVTSLTHID